MPYPSYTDPDQQIAEQLKATLGFPSTAFYDRAGKQVYLRQGGYASDADLVADIKRYALGGGQGRADPGPAATRLAVLVAMALAVACRAAGAPPLDPRLEDRSASPTRSS